MLSNVLGLLGSLSENRKLLVVFDEFQEIAKYKQEGFEKRLKLILLTGGKEMFYANALQAVDLNAGSQVTRALSKIIHSDIVLKNGDYKIQDVMFKKWIQAFLLK